MSELSALVAEQGRDYRSQRVHSEPAWKNRPMMTNWDLDNIASDCDDNFRVSWGKPAQLCQAKMDKECPVCGIRMGKGPEDFQGSYNGEMAFWCPKRTLDMNKYSLLTCSRPPSLWEVVFNKENANIAVSEFSW